MASSSVLVDEALVRAFEPSMFTTFLAQIVKTDDALTSVKTQEPRRKKARSESSSARGGGGGAAASTSDAQDVVVTGIVDADEAVAAKRKAAEARGDFVDIMKIEELEMRSREATEKACGYLRWCADDTSDGRFLRALNVNQLDAILMYVAPAFVKPDDVAHMKKLADSLAPDAEVPVRAVHALLPSPAAATPVVVKKENGDKKGKCKAPNDAMAAARPYSASLCPASCDDSVSACDMSVSSRVALRALAIVAYHHKQALTPVHGPYPKEVELAWSVDDFDARINAITEKRVDFFHHETAIAHGLHWKLKVHYHRGEKFFVGAYPSEALNDDNSCMVVHVKEAQLSAFDDAGNQIEHAEQSYPITTAKAHLYHRSGVYFGSSLSPASLKNFEKAARVTVKLRLTILAMSPSIQNIMRA